MNVYVVTRHYNCPNSDCGNSIESEILGVYTSYWRAEQACKQDVWGGELAYMNNGIKHEIESCYIDLEYRFNKFYKELDFGTLFGKFCLILAKYDPMNINIFGSLSESINEEYDIEACMILKRISTVKSEADMNMLVVDIFNKQFGPLFAVDERYKDISKELWEVWGKFLEIENDKK